MSNTNSIPCRLFLHAKTSNSSVKKSLMIYLRLTMIQEMSPVRIYDHPLSSEITIIEIDSADERKEFLSDIIDGFCKYGYVYPSASLDGGNKSVIYLDRRNMFVTDEDEVLCDLTIQLASIQCGPEDNIIDVTTALAAESKNDMLIKKLADLPVEYYNTFKPVLKAS